MSFCNSFFVSDPNYYELCVKAENALKYCLILNLNIVFQRLIIKINDIAGLNEY